MYKHEHYDLLMIRKKYELKTQKGVIYRSQPGVGPRDATLRPRVAAPGPHPRSLEAAPQDLKIVYRSLKRCVLKGFWFLLDSLHL